MLPDRNLGSCAMCWLQSLFVHVLSHAISRGSSCDNCHIMSWLAVMLCLLACGVSCVLFAQWVSHVPGGHLLA